MVWTTYCRNGFPLPFGRVRVRIPRNPFSRVEPLTRSDRHPACRRAGASSPAEKASKQSARRNGWQQVRAAGCPPSTAGRMPAATSWFVERGVPTKTRLLSPPLSSIGWRRGSGFGRGGAERRPFASFRFTRQQNNLVGSVRFCWRVERGIFHG